MAQFFALFALFFFFLSCLHSKIKLHRKVTNPVIINPSNQDPIEQLPTAQQQQQQQQSTVTVVGIGGGGTTTSSSTTSSSSSTTAQVSSSINLVRDKPLPSISILKPLMGIDPNLQQNLETFFTMNYETVNICWINFRMLFAKKTDFSLHGHSRSVYTIETLLTTCYQRHCY